MTEAIRPFEVGFPEADLAELRRRVNATRWPERERSTGWTFTSFTSAPSTRARCR
jgi:hypothetical protein